MFSRVSVLAILLFALQVVCPAQEDAPATLQEGLEIVAEAPAGKPTDDGRLDYGSPKVELELANERMFEIKHATTDEGYGYTVEKPIMVGSGGPGGSGPLNEQRFLNALAGPNGEKVAYRRRGSGFHFKSDNGFIGDGGVLDAYEVIHKGLDAPVILYINMYDSDTLMIPVGFTKRALP